MKYSTAINSLNCTTINEEILFFLRDCHQNIRDYIKETVLQRKKKKRWHILCKQSVSNEESGKRRMTSDLQTNIR